MYIYKLTCFVVQAHLKSPKKKCLGLDLREIGINHLLTLYTYSSEYFSKSMNMLIPGQIIATSNDRFPPKGSVLEGKSPYFRFQGKLGW